MNIKKCIKGELKNISEKIIVKQKELHEIKKFRNKSLVNIYNKIKLTKEQKLEIDKLYKENYGKKIPYTWHRYFTAFSGKFDKYYFPELLYIPDFEYYMNMDKNYCNTFSDKNVLPIIAKNAGIKMPKTIISSTCGIYKDCDYDVISKEKAIEILSNCGVCFAKPTVDSCSGQGAILLELKNGIDLNTKLKINDLLGKLGNNFVIQEKIECHEAINKLYSKSVNTFRIVTYRWNNEFVHMPITMRIGQGGNYLDNAHAGGMMIAVNDDGVLHKKAFTLLKDEYEIHPDTNIKFENYKIYGLRKVIDAAEKMHMAIPQIGVVNWDFTINGDGEPVLIEANLAAGSIWLIEIAHGKGAFGERTPEILRWLRLIKKAKSEEKHKYKFGKIPN